MNSLETEKYRVIASVITAMDENHACSWSDPANMKAYRLIRRISNFTGEKNIFFVKKRTLFFYLLKKNPKLRAQLKEFIRFYTPDSVCTICKDPYYMHIKLVKHKFESKEVFD